MTTQEIPLPPTANTWDAEQTSIFKTQYQRNKEAVGEFTKRYLLEDMIKENGEECGHDLLNFIFYHTLEEWVDAWERVGKKKLLAHDDEYCYHNLDDIE